jgi:hypothetical protein
MISGVRYDGEIGAFGSIPPAMRAYARAPDGHQAQHDWQRHFSEQRRRGAHDQDTAAIRSKYFEPRVAQQQARDHRRRERQESVPEREPLQVQLARARRPGKRGPGCHAEHPGIPAHRQARCTQRPPLSFRGHGELSRTVTAFLL